MEKRKYRLGEMRAVGMHAMYRVIALRDFADVKEGDRGGWIEYESQLSHEGTCWVYDEAMVFGDFTKIQDDARIRGGVKVTGGTVAGNVELNGDFTMKFGELF